MVLEIQIERSDYIPFFRLSETILGDRLPKLTDEEIMSFLSNANWIAFPMPGEKTKEEIENRPFPHIDLNIQGTTVRIGLRCNTVKSVDRLRNVLESYHSSEKAAILEAMKNLDDDFQTIVYAKIKEHNWSERGKHESKFQIQSNRIDEASIKQMFDTAGKIREEGSSRMRDEHKPHNPVTPVIEIAFVTIPKNDEQLFRAKLTQMERIFETCLKLKTLGFIRSEARRKSKAKLGNREVSFGCPKCGTEYSKEEARSKKFCDVDGMKIHAIFING